MKIALLSILMSIASMGLSSAQTDLRVPSGDDPPSLVIQEDENTRKWDYFLYPVPAVDEINVKITRGYVKIHQINIIDEFGNDLMELRDLNGDKIKIDIAELPEGKYFMQIMPDDKKSVKMKRFYITN